MLWWLWLDWSKNIAWLCTYWDKCKTYSRYTAHGRWVFFCLWWRFMLIFMVTPTFGWLLKNEIQRKIIILQHTNWGENVRQGHPLTRHCPAWQLDDMAFKKQLRSKMYTCRELGLKSIDIVEKRVSCLHLILVTWAVMSHHVLSKFKSREWNCRSLK